MFSDYILRYRSVLLFSAGFRDFFSWLIGFNEEIKSISALKKLPKSDAQVYLLSNFTHTIQYLNKKVH